VKFGFIDAEKAHYPVAVLCRTLEVSRSGYYAWCCRGPSQRQREDVLLGAHVLAAFEESQRTYGSPRVTSELRAGGHSVGRRRVARLMRENALAARQRRRFVQTTMSAHNEPLAPNVLQRDFKATRPNEKWVGDITYLPTAQGFIFLAVLLDLYSRRVVGWAVGPTLQTELAMRALDMALATRRVDGPLVHHTDRGIQYACKEYVQRLEQHGVLRSMSRVGDCWDNAPAESFFSSLKHERKEALNGKQHREDVRRAVLDYIAVYNLERRHSSIGFVSPVEYEDAARMGRAA
jgi:transposase InsO family protein